MFSELCSRLSAVEEDVFRNIKGIHESQNLFDDLIDGEDDFKVAVLASSLGGASGPSPLITRPFDYGSVISYCFDASNWQATRFSDGRWYGVWYGSRDLETTIHETVYHWRRFIMDSYGGEDRIITGERRVCLVACSALLVDLLGMEKDFPGLVDKRDYGFCQAVGAYLKEQDQNGLLVSSARCNGVNVAMFRPERLSNVRDHCYLVYRMNPAGSAVSVERPSTSPSGWEIQVQDG